MAVSGQTLNEAAVIYCVEGEYYLPWVYIDIEGGGVGTPYVMPLPPSLPGTNPLGAGVIGVGTRLHPTKMSRQQMSFAPFPQERFKPARQREDRPGEEAFHFFGGV